MFTNTEALVLVARQHHEELIAAAAEQRLVRLARNGRAARRRPASGSDLPPAA